MDLAGPPNLMWSYLPGVICWGIWKERNKKTFDGKSSFTVGLIIDVVRLLNEWVSIFKNFDEGGFLE